ncbi:hypothetical protein LLG90_10545 [Aromatoleum toluclasticum]|uniref:hypothetical protein n=1 Tax=Aromatoleum toluclasticum TaxID=92003 RepID=UPI001D1837C4|nr:hypothetical protein [Aromatoleum toluclasticum]MCC4115788.1 hypothetical protein [Aromatoleum toluclasticum]
MKQLDELLVRIQGLQEELEAEYRARREELARRRLELADNFLRQQRRYKIGLFRYLRRTRLLVILTAPVVHIGWIPFLLMDLFVTVYQAICFPVYGIPKVRRSDYMVFDRTDLPYLNLIEKINCFYCSYGNGVAAYTREVAARTEQYWCPIKHARRIRQAHDRYPHFFDFGDGEAFRAGLERLRRQYGQDDAPETAHKAHKPD